MSDDGVILRTESLSKRFGRFTALRSTSIDVAPGDFLTIFGRNGAGKTTFLKIAATIIRSYGGDVYLFNKNLREAGDDIRRRLGFVSHESLLYPDLTVYDNLAFYARLYRISDAASTIRRSLQHLGLDARRSAMVRTLSRGMKQRLAIARASLHDPQLLFLDEPFTGLDERAAGILDESLHEFKRTGGTVVMATHNAARGWRHASHVAILDRGTFAYKTSVVDTDFEAFVDRYRGILAQ